MTKEGPKSVVVRSQVDEAILDFRTVTLMEFPKPSKIVEGLLTSFTYRDWSYAFGGYAGGFSLCEIRLMVLVARIDYL